MHAKKAQKQFTKDWEIDRMTMAQKLFQHIASNNPELLEFGQDAELQLSSSDEQPIEDEFDENYKSEEENEDEEVEDVEYELEIKNKRVKDFVDYVEK